MPLSVTRGSYRSIIMLETVYYGMNRCCRKTSSAKKSGRKPYQVQDYRMAGVCTISGPISQKRREHHLLRYLPPCPADDATC